MTQDTKAVDDNECDRCGHKHERNLITQWQPPKGWKLVPEEPTLDMLRSIDGAVQKLRHDTGTQKLSVKPSLLYVTVYKAMVNSAPTPPEERE